MRESENLHTVKIIILTGSSLRKELNRSETFNLAKMCNPYRGMTPKWAACDNEMAHEVIWQQQTRACLLVLGDELGLLLLLLQ